MKTAIIFIAGLAGVITTAQAQKLSPSKVPSSVKHAFTKMHPGVKRVNWEKERSDYEAVFKLNGNEVSENYSPSGKLMESEVAIKVADLPKPVLDYIALHHKGAKITEAAKISKTNGQVQYEAEIAGKDLIFDEKGNPIK